MRQKINYTEVILEILNSEKFRKGIEKINTSFSNLKQEGFIRNLILEELNNQFITMNNDSVKAFAEHPRVNKTRTDLSIVDQNNFERPFKIEFKYQFSGDFNDMSNYHHTINKDFEIRDSNLFILIVAHWNKIEKVNFDEKWGINSNLSRYISKGGNWRNNLSETFKKFNSTELIECETIVSDKPYKTEYHLFILKRINPK